MQHIHARDLEDFLSSFRVNQIIIILYINTSDSFS